VTFLFRLETSAGSPAEPPSLRTAVPNWCPGDTIPLAAGRTLRVVETRASAEPDGDATLIVEDA
jgi:hypothetical protein